MSKVERDNAQEEAEDFVEACINCGLCKAGCPVFKVLKEEVQSPRGRVNMIKNQIYDKSFFNCCLCGGCERKCPLDLKLCNAFRKAREVLVLSKRESRIGKQMIKNLEKIGKVFVEN